MKRAAASCSRGRAREFPFIWFWPDGAPACVMMTHDVEGPEGAKSCGQLMDLDCQFGVRSSFQVRARRPVVVESVHEATVSTSSSAAASR